MTLIEEADSKVILVCPYYRISKWYKLLNTLKSVAQRNVEIEFYVRDGELESIAEIERAGFSPICIPNLHTKLYLNENTGIVSSMNLLLSSENNSLEIAMRTETKGEYDGLYQYYLRYLKNAAGSNASVETSTIDWRQALYTSLSEKCGREPRVQEYTNSLHIDISSKYEALISNNGTTCLEIAGILSKAEFEYARNNKSLFANYGMIIEFQPGKRGEYDIVCGSLKLGKSKSINVLHKDEEGPVVEALVKFIAGIDAFKKQRRY